MKKKMLYGWCGEFGWEIVTVVPEVNVLRRTYDITLLGYGATSGMYADMGITCVDHGLKKRGSGYGLDFGKTQWQNINLNKYKYDVLRIHYNPETPKLKVTPEPKIIREDINPPRDKKKIVVHARRFKNKKTGRNWADKFNESLAYLKNRGFTIEFIGLPEASAYFEKFGADRRTEDISQTIRCLKEASLMIGPASGPSVLSLWCGTPTFSWSCADLRLFSNTRSCGRKRWNPFGINHYHPWSGNETEANLKLYRGSSYKPKLDELVRGFDFALKAEKLV